MLDDLSLFISIIEAGSLNAAAQKVGIPPSTLTRRLQKLEAQLDCKLLIRNARRITPTQEGWQYYEQCRPLIRTLIQTTNQLDDTFNQVEGLIRVLAPINLANGVLEPAWSEFMRRYPAVSLAMELNNRTEDLVDKTADLAIRTGKQPDSLFNMRKLGTIRTNVLVASSCYLENSEAITPKNLVGHKLIVAEPLSIWELQHKDTQERLRFSPEARFSVNEMYLATKMACAGLGVLYCPLNICYDLLQRGGLVQVLPDWHTEPREVFAVWSQQHYLPARIRALIDFLIDFSSKQPLLNGEI